MSVAAEFDLDLMSEPKALPKLREAFREWCTAHGWSERQVGEIVLALDEAVTNVIRHGYEGRPDGRIEIRARMAKLGGGEGLEICVRDFGRQVDPEAICGRDLTDVRPGGLGVHIIRAMNSTVEYQRAAGGGMLLTMTKLRTHVADAPPQDGSTA
jgi:anti-sigma regulatory factor (Ser/Thr protein kinase)